MVEGDLERAEERAEAGESKIVDLEEELRQIGKHIVTIMTTFIKVKLKKSVDQTNIANKKCLQILENII